MINIPIIIDNSPRSLIFFSDNWLMVSSNCLTLGGKTNSARPSNTKTKPIATIRSIIYYWSSPSASVKYSKNSPFGDSTIVVSPSVKALL